MCKKYHLPYLAAYKDLYLILSKKNKVKQKWRSLLKLEEWYWGVRYDEWLQY